MKFTKSGALRFLFSYVFSNVISIAAYAIPVIILSPIIMGTVIDFVTKNSDKYDRFETPLSYGIYAFMLIVFFVCFMVSHIYKNKEMRLQFQKDTKDGFVLKDELAKYIKQYGIPDFVYYVVCSLIAALFTGGTDTMIYDFFIDNLFLRIVPAVFVFALIYTASVALILKIWDKKRPDYLKKGYVEKNNY